MRLGHKLTGAYLLSLDFSAMVPSFALKMYKLVYRSWKDAVGQCNWKNYSRDRDGNLVVGSSNSKVGVLYFRLCW